MSKFLPIFPETSLSLGSLYVRHDLVTQSITVYLKAWHLWDLDTRQIEIAAGVYHFVEPDGDLVGIRSCSIDGVRQEGCTP
ncbi:MAG: hypothetical protein ABFR19_10315 [Pseudomonadota bacterium]